MRIVFTTWAWPSHMYALVPLAWACRSAGHEVVFATQPDLVDEVARTGLTPAVVGPEVDTVGLVRGYLTPAGPVPGPGPAWQPGRGPRAIEMLARHAESMTPGLVELVRDWHADLVVFDPTTIAGPVAAATAGIPAVRHLYGTDLLQRARPLLAEMTSTFGAACDPSGGVTVDPVPPGLQVAADGPRLPIRWTSFNGPSSAPFRVGPPRRRARVCVTWGHTIAKVDSDRFLAGRAAAALGDLPVDVLLAVSSPQVPLVGDLPDNVTVVVDAPLSRLAPECDAVVGHGGAATILTSLAAGRPMLLVPQLPDHAGHSERVRLAGAGLVLDAASATPAALREHVESLLETKELTDAAARVADEIQAQPAPAEVVKAL